MNPDPDITASTSVADTTASTSVTDFSAETEVSETIRDFIIAVNTGRVRYPQHWSHTIFGERTGIAFLKWKEYMVEKTIYIDKNLLVKVSD